MLGSAQFDRFTQAIKNSDATFKVVLNEVPIVNSIVNMAANLAKYSDNVTAQIVYNGWTGNGVRLLIVTTVSVIVVRALLLRFQQWSQQIAMAHGLEHPYNSAWALTFSTWVHQMRREVGRTREQADAAIAIARK